VFEDIILFRWQNNKINANINKKKGRKETNLGVTEDQSWGKKRSIILGQKNINRWGKSKSGSFYTPTPIKSLFTHSKMILG